MIDQVKSARDNCVGSLIPISIIRTKYISVYTIVLSDIGIFYAQVNKVTDKDQGHSLTIFTQGRLDAFRKYASLKKKKSTQGKKDQISDEVMARLKKRANAMTKRMKWEVSDSESEESTSDSDDDTVGSCDSMMMENEL